MRKRMKSLLSLLLAIVMIVSAMPVMGTAEELNPQPAVTGTEVIDPKEPQEELLADCSILKYVDEKEFESHGFLQRCPAEEELNTYVFQLEGGQRAVYFLDENVKFVDETRLILEKDLTLVEGEGGYKTACNDIDVTLPLLLADGISFKYSDVSITVRPVTDKEASAESDERYVEYRDAFGDGTSLVYTPTLSGLKEDIVIDSKDAPETYSFTMYTNGLKLFSDGEGLYLAADEDAEEKVRLGSVQLYDSGDRMGRGEIFTETVSEGEEYMITLVPDQEFLQDERTVYPVTIDPTLTVSDNTHGSNAIWDAPIFSGQPTDNFGTYRYDRLGTPTDVNYGVGRTVVRLKGLTDSELYTSLSVEHIDTVTFHVKESYGTATTQTIKLHPITYGSWSESTVTWNSIGSFNSNVNFGATMTSNEWSTFVITDLVKGWKNSTYTESLGFIMMNANEANNECFDSCESYDQDYRPYVVFKYTNPVTITGSSTKDVDEGDTLQLTATTIPSWATVSWSSDDPSIATVDSNGLVTGVAASSAAVKITASISVYGTPHSAKCYVYVTLEDGIYQLKNQYSYLYLHVQGESIAEHTAVVQKTQYSSNSSEVYKTAQMWRVHYIESGYYSIRPMHKLNMGLTADTSGAVEIKTIGLDDSIYGMTGYSKWTISRYNGVSSGCILRSENYPSNAIHPANVSNAPGAAIVNEAYIASSDFRWTMIKVANPPAGVIIYDTNTNTTGSFTRYVALEETRTLSSMALTATSYYENNNAPDQSVTWKSDNTAIATVDPSSGAVTGVSPGTVTIMARKYINSTYLSDTYTLVVLPISNGTYFLRNKGSGKYADIENGTMSAGTYIEQQSFAGDNSQRWVFTRYEDDYYTIKSANSTGNYYLGIQNDGTSADTPAVLRTGTVTDGMKWKISTSNSGAYIVTSKVSGANNYVLALASNSSNNGTKLVQKAYGNDGLYYDEWTIGFEHEIVSYYDHAFSVRYTGPQSLITGIINNVDTIYRNVMGMKLNSTTPTLIYSTPDYCKQYRGIAINSSNIDNDSIAICPANPSLSSPYCAYYNVNQVGHTDCENCTSWLQTYRDFIRVHPGSDESVSILFNGSKLYNDSGASANRSFKWYDNGIVLQEIKASSYSYSEEMTACLVHEMAHEFGAPDHYHEVIGKDESGKPICRGGDYCGTCPGASAPRPTWCIMDNTWRTDLLTSDINYIFCPGCLSDIMAHFND